MFGYQNVQIQGVLDFHRSGAQIRLLSANNRGGKSTRGAWELVCYATGYNPIRKQHYPLHSVCWAVSLDNKNYGHIIEERLREWLPAGTKWEEAKRRFVLPEPWGSIIYLKSAEPGETKFAAEGLLAAWFDEGREVMAKPFAETLTRLKPGSPLNVFMTMTPEDGSAGWTWNKFYNPESRERYQGAEIFYFTIDECSTELGGHLSPKEIEDFKKNIPDWKRDAKLYGRPGQMAADPYFVPAYIKRTKLRAQTFPFRPGSIETDAAGNIRFKDDDEGDIFLLGESTEEKKFPVPGRPYVVPADVAGGVHQDYTVASVLDPVEKREVAYFKSNRLDPQHAVLMRVLPLLKFFNKAYAIPESNGEHGAIFMNVLRSAKYANIHRDIPTTRVNREALGTYGWRTNGDAQRNMIYDAWQKALRENEWTFSADALLEVGLIAEVDGRPDHPKGRNDDHFFAVGIGLAILELKPSVAKTYRQPQAPAWSGEAQYAV